MRAARKFCNILLSTSTNVFLVLFNVLLCFKLLYDGTIILRKFYTAASQNQDTKVYVSTCTLLEIKFCRTEKCGFTEGLGVSLVAPHLLLGARRPMKHLSYPVLITCSSLNPFVLGRNRSLSEYRRALNYPSDRSCDSKYKRVQSSEGRIISMQNGTVDSVEIR